MYTGNDLQSNYINSNRPYNNNIQYSHRDRRHISRRNTRNCRNNNIRYTYDTHSESFLRYLNEPVEIKYWYDLPSYEMALSQDYPTHLSPHSEQPPPYETSNTNILLPRISKFQKFLNLFK
jgi:hypothetical protein